MQSEMKKTSNIDLKFFMEENTDNDDAFYATLNGLDDQDSINSESENMNTYQKSAFSNKGDEVSELAKFGKTKCSDRHRFQNELPSAPSRFVVLRAEFQQLTNISSFQCILFRLIESN